MTTGTRRRPGSWTRGAGLLTAAALIGGLAAALAIGAGEAADPGGSAGAAAAGPGGAVTIAAAGDIACGRESRGADCVEGRTADLIEEIDPAAVLALGDIQYESSSYLDYLDGYDRSWGRFKDRTYPAIGNHEYNTPVADNYLRYWDDFAAATGPWSDLEGSPKEGWYSFDLGAWHLIGFNSNCRRVSCLEGSEQERWIREDLAAHPARCTLAFAHHPFRNSFFETSKEPRWPDIFQLFYDERVDLVLVGHAHSYERMAPIDPEGEIDRARGVRQIVVGTGGRSPAGASAPPRPFSETHAGKTFGVLELTLRPTGYDWHFQGIPATPVVDMGSGTCH
jgi:calcineurin-like phosphoesterase family protein